MLWCAVVALVITLNLQAQANELETCDIVKELKAQKFPEDQLVDWVCMIQAESQGRTDVIGRCNRNGSRDFGLFQISNDLWCNIGNLPGKLCNARCIDLAAEDITKAAECAKMIHKKRGFMAWMGWQLDCQNKEHLPDISSC